MHLSRVCGGGDDDDGADAGENVLANDGVDAVAVALAVACGHSHYH